MSGICIVIPTLDKAKGWKTGKLALSKAGCKVDVRLIVVHDVKRRGFTATVNEGMRQAKADEDILLLNDDVDGFPQNWLETLHQVLYSDARFGIAGPSGKSKAAPMCDGKPGQKGTQVVRQISFWCALMKRAMIDELGFLDPALIHYRSDNWYCHVMRKRGWKCVWARAVFLKHKHHGSGMQGKWRMHDKAIYDERMRKKE